MTPDMNRRNFLRGLGGSAVLLTTGALVVEALRGPADASAATASTPASTDGHPALVKVRIMGENGQLTGPIEMPRVVKTEAEWHKILTPSQYEITRDKDTETAFCGAFYDNHQDGIYHCVCCNLPLFTSSTKFDSGTGWPSFFQPVAPENVSAKTDTSFGMERTEVHCTRCDGHLGHVFDDGPPPTGQRYCMNSGAMTFVPKGHEVPEPLPPGAKVV